MSMAGSTQLPRLLFTRESDEWETPDVLVAWLNMTFQFTLDPCATSENHKCERYFTTEDDGLTQSWSEERVFLNPPYSQVKLWMQKAYESAQTERATVACLVAVRTDTRWWQDWVLGKANEIQYLAGRVTFKRPGKPANTAPFPSALVVYRPPIERKHTRPPDAGITTHLGSMEATD
jgi:phage N-6-adenine-methyltransferase